MTDQDRAELGISARILRVMLACPGDVEQEIRAFSSEVHAWNEEHGEEYGVVLLPKHWSTHTHPRLGDRPQGVVNAQLTSNADILVAAFWTRLGTDTGVAKSGTAEEILEFYNSGRPVKVYFSDAAPDSLKKATSPEFQSEYQRLSEFRKEVQSRGLVSTYANVVDFRRQLRRHLLQEVRTLRDSGFIPTTPKEPARIERAAVTASPETLRTLKHTVDRLGIDWRSEKDSPMSRYDKGKQIMARLASALSAHIPELRESYTQQQLQPLEDALKPIRELEQAPAVMGETFHKQFWGSGTRVFEAIETEIEELQHA